MNERLRMEYLEAMGIAMFVPRRVLPHAKASLPAALPQSVSEEPAAATPVEPAEVSAPKPTAPRAAPVAVSDIMDSLTRPSAPAEPAPPPEVAPEAEGASVAEVESSVQFALSIWRPSPALMILDSRHAGGALPTQALLDNILRAKGIRLSSTKPDILIWPPGGMTPAPGWRAAREMLQAFLQARLERQPVQYLWLMGESACNAVLANQPYQDNLGKAINVDALGSLAVILPSLADMLQQPALKARTWAAIRAHHVG